MKCGEAETDDVWETKHPKPQCYAAIGWELWRGWGEGGVGGREKCRARVWASMWVTHGVQVVKSSHCSAQIAIVPSPLKKGKHK